jgi:hypothetical protein
MGAPTSEVSYISTKTRLGRPRSFYGHVMGMGGGIIIFGSVHQDMTTCRTCTMIRISVFDKKQNPNVFRICLQLSKIGWCVGGLRDRKYAFGTAVSIFLLRSLYPCTMNASGLCEYFDEVINNIICNRNFYCILTGQ